MSFVFFVQFNKEKYTQLGNHPRPNFLPLQVYPAYLTTNFLDTGYPPHPITLSLKNFPSIGIIYLSFNNLSFSSIVMVIDSEPAGTATQHPGLLLFVQHRTLNSMTAYSVRRADGKVKACCNGITDTPIHHKYNLEGSCNGLLCFARFSVRQGNKEKIFICNPLNGESLTISTPSIPTPSRSTQIYGLGYNPSAKEYMIVHVDVSADSDFKCKVQNMGTESWRDVSSVPSGQIYGRFVSVNGAPFWKVVAKDGEKQIAAFDVEKEEFRSIDLPEVVSERNDLIDLIEIRGSLGFVDSSSSSHIEIWVLKDFEKKQWVRENRIPMKAPEGKMDNSHVKVIGVWEDGEIFLSSNVDAFYSYNPKTGEMRYIHISGVNPDTIISEMVGLTVSVVSARSMLKKEQ